jgi:hypothetical protein
VLFDVVLKLYQLHGFITDYSVEIFRIIILVEELMVFLEGAIL